MLLPATIKGRAQDPSVNRNGSTFNVHGVVPRFDRKWIIRYRNIVTDAELARALERCEVPNAGFHHADHLRVALVYLNESSTVDEAIRRIAATLRRFATSVGQAGKYSQPVTEFWMYQMAAVRALQPDADCDALVRAFPWLLDKRLPVAYYSDDAVAAGPFDSPGDTPDRTVSR